jgi:archaellum biogenesis protein FlaJ (TadC family)
MRTLLFELLRRTIVSNSTEKREVLVTIDAEFAEKIDQLTDNWTEAIEQALRLWYAKQIEDKLRKFYQNRSQEDIEDEKEWFNIVEEQIEEVWSSDGL